MDDHDHLITTPIAGPHQPSSICTASYLYTAELRLHVYVYIEYDCLTVVYFLILCMLYA